ncbi:hypothetical protein C8R32_104265 [Nitrosospira sp. Nsp5]|uniref:Uncharacterized protein n=1 Tax=Nitrosospira multiformis TaxID=1231 RepID=A0ABY0TFN8_9PROT|nr:MULTISPECIES: hypothetical protein [Nitrosospira]PTR09186.1 hypothetical protein C8R32_104265 [Nitrosospira sp. Nsp5]SDQ72901.1 hypothetical protein SAMN05216402_2044 [Nitrosospira multiformis]
MTHKNSMSDDSGDKGSVRQEDETLLKMLRAIESDHEDMNLLGTGIGMYWLGMSLGWEALRVAYIRKILLSYKKTLVTTHSFVSCHGDYEDADLLPQ